MTGMARTSWPDPQERHPSEHHRSRQPAVSQGGRREAKLCYMGHVTMENRHGLAVAGLLSKATGTAERRASEAMLAIRRKLVGRRITVGEDKAYDTADHVARLRAVGITPHVTQNNGQPRPAGAAAAPSTNGRPDTTGYAMSQSRRAMIECIFGWGKQHGTMRKTKHRGICRVAPTSCST